MPELPDVCLYVDALSARIVGETLLDLSLHHPFLLRTAEPPLESLENRRVAAVRRLGKRIVIEMNGGTALALHLMVAGRLSWQPRRIAAGTGAGAAAAGSTDAGKPPTPRRPSKRNPTLAEFSFTSGHLKLTEAGTKRRAALHVLPDAAAAQAMHRGGIEPLDTTLSQFRKTLQQENHTLKRTLTDQRLISGIGNAYSDEILHRARLSPFKQSRAISEQELSRLFHAMQTVLSEWIERLQEQSGDEFPAQVTAFRPEMAVHGKYESACPACGHPVQRIRYADGECNYCAACQTGGTLLADRALSRLLKKDWPKTITELEERHR